MEKTIEKKMTFKKFEMLCRNSDTESIAKIKEVLETYPADFINGKDSQALRSVFIFGEFNIEILKLFLDSPKVDKKHIDTFFDDLLDHAEAWFVTGGSKARFKFNKLVDFINFFIGSEYFKYVESITPWSLKQIVIIYQNNPKMFKVFFKHYKKVGYFSGGYFDALKTIASINSDYLLMCLKVAPLIAVQLFDVLIRVPDTRKKNVLETLEKNGYDFTDQDNWMVKTALSTTNHSLANELMELNSVKEAAIRDGDFELLPQNIRDLFVF